MKACRFYKVRPVKGEMTQEKLIRSFANTTKPTRLYLHGRMEEIPNEGDGETGTV